MQRLRARHQVQCRETALRGVAFGGQLRQAWQRGVAIDVQPREGGRHARIGRRQRHRLGNQRPLGHLDRLEQHKHAGRVRHVARARKRSATEPAAGPIGQRVGQFAGVLGGQRVGRADQPVEGRGTDALHQHRQHLREHRLGVFVRQPIAEQRTVGRPGARVAEPFAPGVAGRPGLGRRRVVQARHVVRNELGEALVVGAQARQGSERHRQMVRQARAVLGVEAGGGIEACVQGGGRHRCHGWHRGEPETTKAGGMPLPS